MVLSNKMHVGSYRQVTRMYLYMIILAIVSTKTSEQLSIEYVERIIRLIEDEKDPRNISYAFQIYQTILTKGSLAVLTPMRQKIFDCL